MISPKHHILWKDLRIPTLSLIKGMTRMLSLNKLSDRIVYLLFLHGLAEKRQETMTSIFIKKGILSSVSLTRSNTLEEFSRVLIKKLLPLWASWLMPLSSYGLDTCTEPKFTKNFRVSLINSQGFCWP